MGCICALYTLIGLFQQWPYLVVIMTMCLSVYCFYNSFKKWKNNYILIDRKGIVCGEGLETKRYLWTDIDRCYFHSQGINAFYGQKLKIVFKKGHPIFGEGIDELIDLDGFIIKQKVFIEELNFYAGRIIFRKEKKDSKEELTSLLKGSLIVILFIAAIMLCLLLKGKPIA